MRDCASPRNVEAGAKDIGAPPRICLHGFGGCSSDSSNRAGDHLARVNADDRSTRPFSRPNSNSLCGWVSRPDDWRMRALLRRDGCESRVERSPDSTLLQQNRTAARGVKQSGVVLRCIARARARARARGLSVVFVTCNPHYAFPVGDRFLILNRGTSIGDYLKSDITVAELTSLMAGGAELETLAHELERR